MTRVPDIHLPPFERLLAQLVATPSVSSPQSDWDQSNTPVVQILADWFEQIGFSCEILSVPEHPGKVNLLATLGSGQGGLVIFPAKSPWQTLLTW